MDGTTLIEATRIIAAIANIAVAFGYAGLGIFLAPKFDAGAPTWALTLFKLSGLLFFLMCSITHTHEAYHIWEGLLPREYWYDALYLSHMIVQAVASGMALVFAFGFINVRVFDKRFTREMIDRMANEATEQIAIGRRREDVGLAAREAAEIRDIATLLLEAYRKETQP